MVYISHVPHTFHFNPLLQVGLFNTNETFTLDLFGDMSHVWYISIETRPNKKHIKLG